MLHLISVHISCVISVNVTLSIDEKVLNNARRVARAMGKSVNQLVREYLEQLAGGGSVEEELAELRRLSGQGHRRDWTFNRDELHERS